MVFSYRETIINHHHHHQQVSTVLGASRLGPGRRAAELLAGKLGAEVPPAVVVAAAVAVAILVGA
jgi:uncharacterized protein YjlB